MNDKLRTVSRYLIPSNQLTNLESVGLAKVLWATVGLVVGITFLTMFELTNGSISRATITLISLGVFFVIIWTYLSWLYFVRLKTKVGLEMLFGSALGVAVAGPVFGLISGVIFGLAYYPGPPAIAMALFVLMPIMMIYYAIVGAILGAIGGLIFQIIVRILDHPFGWGVASLILMVIIGSTPFIFLPRVRLALCRPDCQDRTFVWANLSEVDLSGVNLAHTNFYKAHLSGANLSNADLTGANFRSANFTEANLYGATLNGTETRMADKNGAILPDGTIGK